MHGAKKLHADAVDGSLTRGVCRCGCAASATKTQPCSLDLLAGKCDDSLCCGLSLVSDGPLPTVSCTRSPSSVRFCGAERSCALGGGAAQRLRGAHKQQYACPLSLT